MMSGRNPPLVTLYIASIAMQGLENRRKKHDEVVYSSSLLQ